jgi:hypothetical protein
LDNGTWVRFWRVFGICDARVCCVSGLVWFWFARVFAGIRVTVFAIHALPLCWHPRFAFVLQASPLCGAAPTFLCRRKEK